MSPKLKLIYMNYRGAGEAIRYLLAYGNIDYEDVRIDYEDWPNVKASFPFGQVPVLEIEGKVINQSNAIARYVAKQCGLAGVDDLEALRIDALADTVLDIRQAINDSYWYAKDEDKPAKREKLVKDTLPMFLSRLEKILQDNNGYFVNGKLSYADVVFAGHVQYFSDVMKFNITDGYPLLTTLVDTVNNLPGIKEWISKRPVTEF